MQRNDLYLKDDIIYRVIYISDKLLIVNCIIRSLPYWVNIEFFNESKQISQKELEDATGIKIISDNEATKIEKAAAEYTWGSICNIVLFIHDDAERRRVFNMCCEAFKLSRSTIRKRLCDYLTYQTINVFIHRRNEDKELSVDEKNFRWALNKYYYNPIKMTLVEGYRRMLKERYCDKSGKLLDDIPTFRRYRYYYKKTNTVEKKIISREGKGEFLRNHRTLLGNGIRDFCPAIGYAMLDSTILDIYLINDNNEIIGRPVMTACIDGYSSLCMGYSLGLEGGIKSLKSLIYNVITDKREHCLKYGIDINVEDWNSAELPFKMITDRGKEYLSDTFSQLSELGVEFVNLEPFRPELKGMVEQFFNIIQNYYKSELYNKGVVMVDYNKRGSPDYISKASLTLDEFERIIILCIIKYNSKRVIDLPYELDGIIKPFASELWNYSKEINSNNLLKLCKEYARLIMLPRVEATFRRDGLKINRLRYRNYNYMDRYLNKKDKVIVAYDPLNVSTVWLVEEGNYISFDIIDKYFMNKSVDEVNEILKKKKDSKKGAYKEELQARIDLSKEIESIAHATTPMRVDKKNIKKHRREEIRKLSIKHEHGKY